MSRFDIMEQWNGLIIRCIRAEGRPLYVSKVYRGVYGWTTDYTYARHFSASAAKKHLEQLNAMHLDLT